MLCPGNRSKLTARKVAEVDCFTSRARCTFAALSAHHRATDLLKISLQRWKGKVAVKPIAMFEAIVERNCESSGPRIGTVNQAILRFSVRIPGACTRFRGRT